VNADLSLTAQTDGMRIGRAGVNRTQQLVLGFVVLAWMALVVILLVSPEIYDRSLPAGGSRRRLGEWGFLVVLSGLLVLLGLAVVRRWRWAFWLILVAFFAGLLRVPAAALELSGHLSTADPAWYVVVQAVVGVIQFLIATAMFIGYRRSGVWGEF
jgi:hypothetical protein